MPSSPTACAMAGNVRATSCSTKAGVAAAFFFFSEGIAGCTEAFQIAVDRLAILANGRLELLEPERQPSAAGDSAEHHRIDDRAALFCQCVHVDEESVFRMLVDELDKLVLIEASITHRDLFIHRIEAAQ